MNSKAKILPPGPAPIIGVTTYGRNEKGHYHLPAAYVDAVRKAGGLPLLLPPGEPNWEYSLALFDGVILAGGGDIDPARYGAEGNAALERVDQERDEFEIALATRLLQLDLPVLGVCRGMQVLNVAAGGDLVVHIPDTYGERILHRQPGKPFVEHLVEIEPESRLAQIVGPEPLRVVSLHHQSPGRLGRNWRSTSTAADGVLEAMEHQSHPWLIAVQWHPEMAPEDPRQQALFRALVQRAREHRSHRRAEN